MTIGKVTYQNIEMGFWGIIEDNGTKWMIVNMPEQLKKDGEAVRVTLEPIDAMSFAMWGSPAKVVRFETLCPKKLNTKKERTLSSTKSSP